MANLNNEFTSFINTDGTLVVELDRALHRECPTVVPRAFRIPHEDRICQKPIRYLRDEQDPKAGKATIGFYVDDILLTCTYPFIADNIIQGLEKEYK